MGPISAMMEAAELAATLSVKDDREIEIVICKDQIEVRGIFNTRTAWRHHKMLVAWRMFAINPRTLETAVRVVRRKLDNFAAEEQK